MFHTRAEDGAFIKVHLRRECAASGPFCKGYFTEICPVFVAPVVAVQPSGWRSWAGSTLPHHLSPPVGLKLVSVDHVLLF